MTNVLRRAAWVGVCLGTVVTAIGCLSNSEVPVGDAGDAGDVVDAGDVSVHETGCTPTCAGVCGASDGCGGKCPVGSCAKPGYKCVAGTCVCTPSCATCGVDDGCGGKCTTGACSAGYKCQSTASCELDPASKWVIRVTNGSMPKDDGSNTFSLPDPMVCLYIGGKRLCTQEALDTLSPTWGCTFPPVAASALLAGVDVEMWDNDRSGAGVCGEEVLTDPGNNICSKGKVAVTTANFATRSWSASCTTLSFNATLTPL